MQTLSLALDKGNAVLKPKKAAHNQIWLIEPEDAELDEPLPDYNDSSKPTEVAKDLSEGEYIIKSKDTLAVCVGLTKAPTGDYTCAPTSESAANKFKLERSGEDVVLFATINRQKIYLAFAGNNVFGRRDAAFRWKIVESSQPRQYYILDGSRNLVLTAPKSNSSPFTLEHQSQASEKLWQFVVWS